MRKLSNSWDKELLAQIKSDINCQQCLAEVARLQPAFDLVRHKLSEADKDTLDLYIAACEELEYSHIYPAYILGLSHAGQKGELQP